MREILAEAVRISAIVAKNKGTEFDSRDHLRFLTLALAGEVGELANLIKKDWRGTPGQSIDENFEAVDEEVADCYIYLMLIAENLGIDLKLAAEAKLKKVAQKPFAQPK